ncbi:MAG: hypothetical protein WC501_04645 [Candidatus Micrarchaeia archaeon]
MKLKWRSAKKLGETKPESKKKRRSYFGKFFGSALVCAIIATIVIPRTLLKDEINLREYDKKDQETVRQDIQCESLEGTKFFVDNECVTIKPWEKRIIAKEGEYFITVDFSPGGTYSEVEVNEIDIKRRLEEGYTPLESIKSFRSIVNRTTVKDKMEEVIVHWGNKDTVISFPFKPEVMPVHRGTMALGRIKKETHMMTGKTEYKFSREVGGGQFGETKVYLDGKNPAAVLPDNSLIVLTKVIKEKMDTKPEFFIEGHLNDGAVRAENCFRFESEYGWTFEGKSSDKTYSIKIGNENLGNFPNIPVEVIISSRHRCSCGCGFSEVQFGSHFSFIQ